MQPLDIPSLINSLTDLPVANLRWASNLHKLKQTYVGEWSNEPDDITWYLPDSKIICCMHRHFSYGFWCGYLGLTNNPGNYAEGAPFHGGVSYESATLGCYEPNKDEPTIKWWVGFDCGHYFDLQPFNTRFSNLRGVHYRNVEYVANNLLTAVEYFKNYAAATQANSL